MIPANVEQGQPIPAGVAVERWEAGKIGSPRTPGGEAPKGEYKSGALSKAPIEGDNDGRR
jgi:hypothetical protein